MTMENKVGQEPRGEGPTAVDIGQEVGQKRREAEGGGGGGGGG